MRLIDLSPEWEHENTYLTFRCPKCARDRDEDRPVLLAAGYAKKGDCFIMIPTKVTAENDHAWGWNGETDFEKVTISPSIWHHCDSDPHFFIRNGEIQMA